VRVKMKMRVIRCCVGLNNLAWRCIYGFDRGLDVQTSKYCRLLKFILAFTKSSCACALDCVDFDD
jgi:hypothetical protein